MTRLLTSPHDLRSRPQSPTDGSAREIHLSIRRARKARLVYAYQVVLMMRAYYVTARWLRILVFALTGSLFVAYVAPVIARWSEQKLDAATAGNLAASTALAALLLVGSLSAIHTFARFRLQHAIWLSFPPLPIAVVLAFGLGALWCTIGPSLPHSDASVCLIVGAAYACFWLAAATVASAVTLLKNRLEAGDEAPALAAAAAGVDQLTDEQLAHWMIREQPINTPAEDLFGFWEFTQNVMRKLTPIGNTIGIQGGFGTGKTSFIRLLQFRADQQRSNLYFVRVSCWGFEDAVAAQKSVLSTLVKNLNERVECLSIRQLPNEYVAVASKKLEWLRLVSTADETPVEQLQRLAPILTAVGRRVVVVLEDVDRTGQRFDVATVFALLAQFREVRNLAFILTISPHQAVDFAKLCEFTEILPTPTTKQVATLCQRVRDRLIQQFPDDILVDKVKDLLGTTQLDSLAALMLPGAKDWPTAIVSLLRAPRYLKRALRRLSDAWQILHGEVSIDALLMTCVIRESAPAAFSFLVSELDDLLLTASNDTSAFEGTKEYVSTVRTRLKQRWQEIIDRREFDVPAIEIVVQHLFPGTSFLSDLTVYPSVLKQGPSGDRARTYALRLFTEQVDVNE